MDLRQKMNSALMLNARGLRLCPYRCASVETSLAMANTMAEKTKGPPPIKLN